MGSAKTLALITLLATMLAACGQSEPPSPHPPKAVAEPAVVADANYSGGEIISMNDRQPSAEAVAVKDGRILADGG